ncbi:MAG: hypothetical protein HY806_09065 [Nitrospirae bacterium]|nr:hypothetical protein [Nitrospirota bacterium]
MIKNWSFNKIFIGLILFLFLINLPVFFNIVNCGFDTVACYQGFFFHYNELYYNNELPFWIPFGNYGLAEYSVPLSYSPSAYLTLFSGWLLKIKEVLMLFKVSLFLEQIVFLLGMYMLSNRLFKNKTTVLFVCISALGSQFLLDQVVFNFRGYSHAPLIIYFIVRFFEDYKLRRLALAASVFFISLFGTTHLAPIQLLPVMIICGILFTGNYKGLYRRFSLDKKDIVLTLLYTAFLITLAAAWYSYIQNSQKFTQSLTYGRDPVTMHTYLDVFLTYGANINFKKFLDLLIPAGFSTESITLFVGLTPLVFVIYGFIRVRALLFFAFAAVVVILGLLSAGDKTPVAELLYRYSPGMKYYRHIGFVAASFKMFLPLMAGFGLDYFLKELNSRDKAGREIIMLISAGAVLLAAASGVFIGLTDRAWLNIFLIAVPAACILSFAGFYKYFYDKIFYIKVVLVVCIAMEMFIYRGILTSGYYPMSQERRPIYQYAEVNKYAFPITRAASPPDLRSFTIYPSLFLQHVCSYVVSVYNFIQWDACMSEFRNDFLTKNVLNLINLKGGEFGGWMQVFLPKDINFRYSLGCESPKLKIISNVIFTNNIDEAMKAVKATKNINEVIVLSQVPEHLRHDKDLGPAEGDKSFIKVTDYKANGLELEVFSSGNNLWLYYADAWHPDWKAFLNDKPVYIAQANLAFKAIKLEKGENRVRFVFDDRYGKRLAYILILGELLFMAAILLKAAAVAVQNKDEGGV